MKKRKNISRLFIRFISMYLIIILIPMISWNVFIYQHYLKYIQSTLENNSVSSLQSVQQAHQHYMDQMSAVVKQLYLSDNFHIFTLPESPDLAYALTQELSMLSYTTDFPDKILLHFPDSPYVYTSSGSSSLDILNQNIWGEASAQARAFWENIHKTNIPVTVCSRLSDGKPHPNSQIMYCYPVPCSTFSQNAVIIFSLSLSEHKQFLQNIHTEFCNTYIEQAGKIIIADENLSISPELFDYLSSSDVPTEYYSEGSAKYMIIRVAEPYSYTNYYQIFSLQDILQPLTQIKHKLNLINLCLLLLCGVLMFYFSLINYRPVHTILKYLKAIKPTAVSASKNEWDEMMAGFTYMYEQNRSLGLKYATSRHARRSMLLLDFIKGRLYDIEDYTALCKEANFDIDHPYFTALLIRFDATTQCAPDDTVVTELLNRPFRDMVCYSTELLSNQSLIVISFLDNPEIKFETYEALWARLLRLGIHGTAALSNIHSAFDEAPKALIEASTAMMLRSNRKNEIMRFSEIEQAHNFMGTYPFDLLEDFQKAVSKNQYDSITYLADRISEIALKKNTPQLIQQNILKDMINTLIKYSIQFEDIRSDLYRLYQQVMCDNFDAHLEEIIYKIQEICRNFSSVLSRECELPENCLDAQAQTIIRYIDGNCLSSDFSLYNAAEFFHISPSQLTSYFKSTMHISPTAYITNYKIQKAKLLLTQTNRSIAEISLDIGYCDASSFTRKFKQITGTTPLAYRRGQRQCGNSPARECGKSTD